MRPGAERQAEPPIGRSVKPRGIVPCRMAFRRIAAAAGAELKFDRI